ncbi:MAG: alginate lyase family protein [Deltaproteobacteria bacterium]|nr:alginate lyase family protein [Deltaproteobacteria bacterium]
MIEGFKSDFFERLRRASAAEIAYRVRKKLTARKIKARLAKGRSPFGIPSVDPGHIASLEPPVITVLSAEAPRLIADPEEITRFEVKYRNTFFDAIHPGPTDPDIRSVWEPARLQNATLLLLCPGKGPESRQAAKKTVLQWIQDNPFLRGPHYLSAMECGLRVPVFFYCLKRAPDVSTEEREVLCRAIYEHASWIEKNLSLYASLGNHTVCECVGLIFGGAVFRHHLEGRRWVEMGCRILDRELAHQVLSDGGPAEQSFSYHRFVLDLYWLASDFLEKNRLHDFAGWKERLLKGEAFLLAFQGKDGLSPSIGDSDDGYAVAPGVAPLRGTAETPQDWITTFPDSGYTIVRGSGGLILTFDHGPLGMPPLYNHGHADALAITLSSEGKPILVDPGTFRYNGVPEWRRYFKGTRAHNTVTVDEQDQAVQETGFIWGKPYRAGLEKVAEGDRWVLLKGAHNGYERLGSAVTHERTVFFEKDSSILIKDSFKGKEDHDFELNFHLHPEAAVEESDGWIKVNIAGVEAFVRLLESGRFEVIRGRENPIHGWCSPAYGIKMPGPVLSSRVRMAAEETIFFTAVCLGEPCDVSALKSRFLDIANR